MPEMPYFPKTVHFADGTALLVRVPTADDVVGKDADGDVLVPFLDYFIPLTPCCFRDGKGSSNSHTGVCCRGCYRPVSVKFGGPSELAVARVGV